MKGPASFACTDDKDMSRVLVIDSAYRPILAINHRKAFCMVYSGRAEIMEVYEDRFLKYPEPINIPAVIRIKYVDTLHVKSKNPSRKAILLRDGYTCVYCGRWLSHKNSTIDHVMPKSRGGKNTWENLVCSCESCNLKKGDRTPEEAGMKISTDLSHKVADWKRDPEPEWSIYL